MVLCVAAVQSACLFVAVTRSRCPPLLLIADFDSALKAVEGEYAAAEKELGGTRKKAEDAAAAMKALEHKDTKVRLWGTSHTPMLTLCCALGAAGGVVLSILALRT